MILMKDLMPLAVDYDDWMLNPMVVFADIEKLWGPHPYNIAPKVCAFLRKDVNKGFAERERE